MSPLLNAKSLFDTTPENSPKKIHCCIAKLFFGRQVAKLREKTAAAHKPSDRAWKQQKPRSKRQKEDICLSIPRCLPMSTRQSSIDAGINYSGPDLDLGERKGF
jgi:hypothetical protein